MEDPVSDLTTEEASAMAMAAAEAAAAAEEQEQQQLSRHHLEANGGHLDQNHRIFAPDDGRVKCRICHKGLDDDGRVLCRFLPTIVDANTMEVAPGVMTFGDDIAIHVFCGKTASILPNVNQPDLEILSKAGIKNKHGIGPEVNGALARTRSSTVSAEGAKEKTFFIVKEFEAHLAAIRNASMSAAASHSAAANHHLSQPTSPFQHHQHTVPHHSIHPGTPLVDVNSGPPVDPAFDPLYQHSAAHHHHLSKVIPIKVSHSYQKRDPWALPATEVTITSDGKIRCGCGGTHLPTGTARGDASWRSHVMTKRHQKWMEENGLLGAV